MTLYGSVEVPEVEVAIAEVTKGITLAQPIADLVRDEAMLLVFSNILW